MSLKIFNLKTGKYEDEKVCAESFMRFLYANPAGAPLNFIFFKRAFFSRIFGLWANSRISRKAALRFIDENGIDISDAAMPTSSYRVFNDFFTRALAVGARPLGGAGNPRAVSFPSDGRHLLIQNVSECDAFYAKAQKFNLAKFLGDASLAKRFAGGDMLISRLSPLDYHRFHFPVSGEIAARRNIGGHLSSVNPIALAGALRILWENRRVLNIIESPVFGMCAFVEIGATNVGSIENFAPVGSKVERGEEAGLFKFGGSCVATIFPSSAKIEWNRALAQKSSEGVECYARANELAGILK